MPYIPWNMTQNPKEISIKTHGKSDPLDVSTTPQNACGTISRWWQSPCPSQSLTETGWKSARFHGQSLIVQKVGEHNSNFTMVYHRYISISITTILVGGDFNPSEKNEFVSWDDDIPNIWKNKKCSKTPTSDSPQNMFFWWISSRSWDITMVK